MLFVYNADSNFLNKYIDIAHKIISPTTYSCDLCSLTHGNFLEKKAWREYREGVDHVFRFRYKNDFLATFKGEAYKTFRFPIILENKMNGFDVILDAEQLRLTQTIEDLIKALEEKLD